MSPFEVQISAADGGWTVAFAGVSLAGFYGPNARNMAESHRDLLVAALTSDAYERSMQQQRDLPVAG
jgi:hypothetical protein